MTIMVTSSDNMPLVEFLRATRLPDRPRRRAIRIAVGASIRDVAKACNVSHFAVYAWEKPDGTIEPRPAHALVYKRVLDDLEALGQELADATEK